MRESWESQKCGGIYLLTEKHIFWQKNLENSLKLKGEIKTYVQYLYIFNCRVQKKTLVFKIEQLQKKSKALNKNNWR